MRDKLIQSCYQQSISISSLAWIESIMELLKNKQFQQLTSLKLTDQQVTRLILFLLEHPEIEKKEILNLLCYQNLIHGMQSGFLKNYVLIHLAEFTSLKSWLDENARIHLAYTALHASVELRSHLFKHLDHFEIQNLNVLADLGYKGILLGNIEDFNIELFIKLPFKQLIQLLHTLKIQSAIKAYQEAKKLLSYYPQQKAFIQKLFY